MTDDVRTLNDLLDGERIAMLVTADHRARPMMVLDNERDRLWFLTSKAVDWVERLKDEERVTLTLADTDDALFVSLTGTIGTTTDQAKLDELWNPAMDAWFDGREDPNLVALHVDVVDGEWWDGPGTGVGRAIRGLAGVITGDGERTMGEKGDVAS